MSMFISELYAFAIRTTAVSCVCPQLDMEMIVGQAGLSNLC